MIQNKITIEGEEFEIEQDDLSFDYNTPVMKFRGKRYIGKAIPNKPDKDYEIICYEIDVKTGKEIIKSVVRLSDNEVFTVGDKVMWNLPEQTKTPFTIKSFEINDVLPQKRMFCNRNNIDICYLKKAVERIPLFYADAGGTPIYDQQQYYWVGYPVNEITHKIAHRGITYNFLEEQRAFSTFEKSKDYVLMNKADKSINDVLNLFDNSRSYVGMDLLKERLIEFTKEKLKI